MVNKIVFKLFIILLMIFLITYLWIDSSNLSCNQCTVTFSNNKVSGVSFVESNKKIVNMTDLYNDFKLNESCLVSWSRTNGYG